MKGQSVFLVVLLLLISSVVSVAQNPLNIEYYTVLPQITYTIPDSTTLLKTTVCTSGTEPGFGHELNTPGFNGVAGSRSYHIKSYPAPEGYEFYNMMLQLSKGKEKVSFDINKTYIITNNGYKSYPYYALPTIIGSVSDEKDLLMQESFDKPFIISFPEGKKQKYVSIWYAIPINDIPVTYEFYGSPCEVKKYEKGKK